MSRSGLKTTGVRKALLRSQLLSKKIKMSNSEPTAQATDKLETPKCHPVASLRASITPGTILILLAGRFRGKRVVFLKQLPSGLLLVSGPYKYNGVPLQRVNQAYVIATSTKVVDASNFQLSPKLDDALFARPEKQPAAVKKEFLPENAMEVEKKKASAERIALQKEVDTQIIQAVKKVPLLSAYLKSVFTLRKGQAPHSLKF